MSAEHKWVKGVSGNPTGKRKDGQPRKQRNKIPPGLSRAELIKLAQSYSKEAIERLVAHMRSDKDPRTSVRAAQIILERGYGAPPDRIEATMVLRGDAASGGEDIQIILVHPTPQPDDESHMIH
jgi:hypothetical protein